jgi:hypothetical protein
MTRAKLLAGASGYSYDEWRGSFYPADMKSDDMLAWYAQRLPTVEKFRHDTWFDDEVCDALKAVGSRCAYQASMSSDFMSAG